MSRQAGLRRVPRSPERPAPETPLELEWAAERLLHRDLLVQGEPDEEGQRVLRQQAVGGFVAGER
ncbi:MAG: hypothetical protein WKF78_04045 [Candidatus Limnocylindrales bacterium]